MDIVARFGKMEFSLEVEEVEKMVGGMENFKYLGRTLDQTYDDWPVVGLNIMRARLVWGRMRTLLRREGADPRVSEMFYRAVA